MPVKVRVKDHERSIMAGTELPDSLEEAQAFLIVLIFTLPKAATLLGSFKGSFRFSSIFRGRLFRETQDLFPEHNGVLKLRESMNPRCFDTRLLCARSRVG